MRLAMLACCSASPQGSTVTVLDGLLEPDQGAGRVATRELGGLTYSDYLAVRSNIPGPPLRFRRYSNYPLMPGASKWIDLRLVIVILAVHSRNSGVASDCPDDRTFHDPN
jgi:hypothetical protein